MRHIIHLQLEEDAETRRFAKRLYLKALDNRQMADEIISEHARNWDLNRIALLDRLVLRMAITELQLFKQIPPKVTINEAIEIAKAYSTEKSGNFINGLLDAVLKTLKKRGRLNKEGRGLVGMNASSMS